jgi:MFS family permease
MGVAGLAVGATGPSRDWIVKRATPPGATGRVYGFVYCGLDVGSVLSPTLFGWFVDRSIPGAAYAIVVATLILAIFTVLDIRRLTAAPAPALRAAE